MTLRINNMIFNKSLADGPGIRSLIFFQGCDLYCEGCHNKQTWDIDGGKEYTNAELERIIRQECFNKKITITGGEPLLQYKGLLELLKKLKDFDICLYTGRLLIEVPKEILKYIKYLKVGPYIENLRTTTVPFVGSTNQKFLEVEKIDYETSI